MAKKNELLERWKKETIKFAVALAEANDKLIEHGLSPVLPK